MANQEKVMGVLVPGTATYSYSMSCACGASLGSVTANTPGLFKNDRRLKAGDCASCAALKVAHRIVAITAALPESAKEPVKNGI